MFLQTAEVVCAPHTPPHPSPAPENQRLSDPEQPKESLLFLLRHVPDTAPAKNTPLSGGASGKVLRSLHTPPAPDHPLLGRSWASSSLRPGRGLSSHREAPGAQESLCTGLW